mgnify:CR=1 FL=1
MITAIILLSIILIGSLYANYNLLKNYEKSEEYVENLETWVVIDRKGSFESDDEVGYFYKELKRIMDELNTLGEENDAARKR